MAINYKSMAWVPGTRKLTGIMTDVYFIRKADIVNWPTLPATFTTSMGQLVTYDGNFTLAANAKWQKITTDVDKSPVDGKSQGNVPSKTFLNSLTLLHESTEEDASAFAMQANNDDLIYIVKTKNGKYRVIGNEMWQTKTEVDQKLGAQATDEMGTTITITVTDIAPGLFYAGNIVAEEGTIEIGA